MEAFFSRRVPVGCGQGGKKNAILFRFLLYFHYEFGDILARSLSLPSTIDSRVAQGYDVVNISIFFGPHGGSKINSVGGCLKHQRGQRCLKNVFLACSKRRR